MLRRCLLAVFASVSLAQAQTPAPVPPAPAPVQPAPAVPAKAVVAPPAAPGAAPAPAAPTDEKPTLQDDATRVAVLGYHDFSETLPETAMRMHTSKFRKQMAAIKQLGLTVITLDDFLAWKRGEKTLPERCVLIGLDDGWKSVYTDAFPILKEYGYPFTLYLYKEYVDGGGKALSSEMIAEMMKSGASIGSHSVTHPYPGVVKGQKKKGTDVFDAFLRKEFGESKRFLESKFPYKVTTYAYPGGYHCEEMYPIAQEFGYAALFTVIPQKVKRTTPNTSVPRYMILGNYDKIFDLATSFNEGGSGGPPPIGAVPGAPQTTPVPVNPPAGQMINTRLPMISVDLSTIQDLDPASLVMKIPGLGEVPAQYNPTTKSFFWQMNRKIRQTSCQVTVNWKDTKGKAPEIPLRWTFQIDRSAVYLPDDSDK